MTDKDFIKSLAALTAWREENENGLNGMLGVLFVIRRRAEKWYSGDWAKAIEAHGQFSSMSILGDGQTVKYPDVREPVFAKLLSWMDSMYDGTAEDKLTQGAFYYSDLSSPAYVKDGWFDRVIVAYPETHPRVAVVGSTTYFA